MEIINMTPEYASEIARWRYEGVYSIYDHTGSDPGGFLDGAHYACISGSVLTGYFCFGADARLPTVEKGVYDGGCMDIGLGMKPELCGQGLGSDFLAAGLAFARERLGCVRFRLSVAAFNERAVKVYSRAGFRITRDVIRARCGTRFHIMTLGC